MNLDLQKNCKANRSTPCTLHPDSFSVNNLHSTHNTIIKTRKLALSKAPKVVALFKFPQLAPKGSVVQIINLKKFSCL